MKTDKSLDLESASWRPTRVDGSGGGRLMTQEEPVFHFQSRGKKKPVSQFEGGQAVIPSYMGEGQPC